MHILLNSDQAARNLTRVYENGLYESEMLVWDWERNHWWNYSWNIHPDQKLSPKGLLMADLDYLYYFITIQTPMILCIAIL